VRGILGRLFNVNDMKHWYLHADKIIIHPNYTHASKNQLAFLDENSN